MQYIFDFMSRGKGEIIQVFDFLGELPETARDFGYMPSDPDGLSFQKKEQFKPLQTADILAWNTYSFMQQEISRGLPDKPGRLTTSVFQCALAKQTNANRLLSRGRVRDAGSGLLDYEEREGQPGYLLSRQQLRARARAALPFGPGLNR